MPDVLTDRFGFVKQTIGGNRNSWGGILNGNFDTIEAAIAGALELSVTGGSTTLTDEQRTNAILNFTGTLTADHTIVVENLSQKWLVRNGTAGAFALKIKTSSGSAITIPQGGFSEVWCDGNDVVYQSISTRWRDTQVEAPAGTLAAPGLSFAAEVASGFRRISAGLFAWVVGGVDIIKVSGTELLATFADAGIAFTKALTVPSLAVTTSLTVGGTTPVPIGGQMPYSGIDEPNGWVFEYGQDLSRTTYALLLAVLSKTATATRAAGSPTLTGVSVDLTGKGLEGAKIEGTGINASATIVSLTANTITMSHNASGSGALTITILPYGATDSSTFKVPDKRGRGSMGRDNMGGTSANRMTGVSGSLDADKLGNTGGAEQVTLVANNVPAHKHPITDVAHEHVMRAVNSAASTSLPASTRSLGVSVGGDIYVAGAPDTDLRADTVSESMTGITTTENNTTTTNPVTTVPPSQADNWIIFTGVFA